MLELDQFYSENAIRTFTGKAFDLKILDPDTICIEDIAHGLSNVMRFGGHLGAHYSVAQHCCFVALNCSDENQFAGLMHDASEAYIGDMPSPFKKMMPDYKQIENNLMQAIAKKFKFQYPLPSEIKELDYYALCQEWTEIVCGKNYTGCWPAEKAKAEFLRLYELFKK